MKEEEREKRGASDAERNVDYCAFICPFIRDWLYLNHIIFFISILITSYWFPTYGY